MTTRSRTTAGLSILAAVAIAVAGCSGNTKSDAQAEKVAAVSPAEIVLAANTKMTAAQSAKMRGQYDVTVPGQPAVTMKADGVFDAKTGNAEMTMTLPGMGDVVVRMVGGAVYAKVPAQFASMTPKPWLKVDVAQLGAAMGSFGSQNPADQLDMLNGLTGVEEVGTETLDGVKTTHYKGTVDFDKVLAAVKDPAGRKNVESIKKVLAGKTMPAEVWIDEQGLPRKMTFTMTVKAPTASGTTGDAKIAGTMTLSDFGIPVKVAAPPASDVSDMKELTGQ